MESITAVSLPHSIIEHVYAIVWQAATAALGAHLLKVDIVGSSALDTVAVGEGAGPKIRSTSNPLLRTFSFWPVLNLIDADICN